MGREDLKKRIKEMIDEFTLYKYNGRFYEAVEKVINDSEVKATNLSVYISNNIVKVTYIVDNEIETIRGSYE